MDQNQWGTRQFLTESVIFVFRISLYQLRERLENQWRILCRQSTSLLLTDFNNPANIIILGPTIGPWPNNPPLLGLRCFRSTHLIFIVSSRERGREKKKYILFCIFRSILNLVSLTYNTDVGIYVYKHHQSEITKHGGQGNKSTDTNTPNNKLYVWFLTCTVFELSPQEYTTCQCIRHISDIWQKPTFSLLICFLRT